MVQVINVESDILNYSENTLKSGKKSLKNSKKLIGNLTNTLNLLGRYHWLIDNQNEAVKIWNKATATGERLGMRPDLARTYMEIGKRFLEKRSNYKELNGVSAEEYMKKARTMFQDMDLQWDLDELDKINMTS